MQSLSQRCLPNTNQRQLPISSQPPAADPAPTFESYETAGFYDELIDDRGQPRGGSELLIRKLESLAPGDLLHRQPAAERTLLRMGITFAVYGDDRGGEKIFPFDVVPRIVDADEWDRIERGLKQRIRALNLFIDDIYHDQRILKDGVVPREMLMSASSYRAVCQGLNPPHGIWCHITGTDLVRDDDGQIYVLEDNLRCPSGVSYVLQNRVVMKRTFPQIFEASHVRPVVDYPSRLLSTLEHLAPAWRRIPDGRRADAGRLQLGLLRAFVPGSTNGRRIGRRPRSGRSRRVSSTCGRPKGFQRVDVIYRRIDDDFIDPQAFRPESMLGVPGLMDAYRKGTRGAGQCAGQRRGRRQGRSTPTSRR